MAENPVVLAHDEASFLHLCVRVSPPALRAVRSLLCDVALLAPSGPAQRFRAQLQRLLGHWLLRPPAEPDPERLLEATRLWQLDLVRRENAALLLQWPQLLSGALWLQVVAVIVRRAAPAPGPPAALRPLPRRPPPVPRVALDVAQELVFSDMLRLLHQAPDAAATTPRPAKRPRGAALDLPPSSGALAAAQALRAWQHDQRERWRGWVHLGVRRQPPEEKEDAHKADGGLVFTLYADLLNILHSQFVPPLADPSTLSVFLSVDPALLRPNSELFLFRKGCVPLWEATPLGANLDHDFSDPADLLPLWTALALAALRQLFWDEALGLQGFALVKRWNGRFRLTLWLDRWEEGVAVPPLLLNALPPALKARPYRYRPNAARIAKHVLDEAQH